MKKSLPFLFLFVIAISLTSYTAYEQLSEAPHQLIYAQTAQLTQLYGRTSPFNRRIPSNAVYTRDGRITTIRPAAEQFSVPIYRIASSHSAPTIHVTNPYGRTADWPIPSTATPATGTDHHMAVIDEADRKVYEMWDANRTGNGIFAGNFAEFSADGNAISNPPAHTVTASGLSVLAGMITREDFLNSVTGQLNPNQQIDHALAMSLPGRIIQRQVFVAPAGKGEASGADNGGVPMGALYALPRDLNIDALPVSPLTKSLARAARDYGIYVNDHNGTQPYNGGAIGTVRVEPGLTRQLYGQDNDALMNTVMTEMGDIIHKYGLYRVTGVDFSYINNAPEPISPVSVLPSPQPTSQPTHQPIPAPSQPPMSSQPGLSTTGGTTLDIYASADVSVRQTEPNTNSGKDVLLKVGGSTGDITYVRFNLAGLAGKKITSAKLKLSVSNISPSTQVISLVNDNSWNETMMTFSNRPAFAQTIGTMHIGDQAGYHDIDLTSFIANKAGNIFTLAISSSSQDGMWMGSRESTTPPVLRVTYQ